MAALIAALIAAQFEVYHFSHIQLFYWERYCKGYDRRRDGNQYSHYSCLSDDGTDEFPLAEGR